MIAIIDDESKIRDTIRSYLQNEGFDTVEGDDGVAAVQLAKNEHVDLILLDVMMPNLDGIGALREIRSDS